MSKKQKDETPNVNATANRDIVQRLNFLYQASVYLQSVAPFDSTNEEKPKLSDKATSKQNTNDSDDIKKSGNKTARRRIGKKNTTGDLARDYIQSMRIVGQKTTVKIDPSLKRSLCSKCNTPYIPGSSVSIRVKSSPCHGHIVVYTCLNCQTTKRIPAPPISKSIESEDQILSSGKTSLPIDSLATRGKKRHPFPHPLPLFARPDAGHVTFRGNDQLADDFGLFFTATN